MTAQVGCFFPSKDDYDQEEPPEGYEEWRDPSGFCTHDYCIEGNRIGRLYASSKRVSGMTRDEIDSIRADHELVAEHFHGWVLDEGMGYVVVAEEAS